MEGGCVDKRNSDKENRGNGEEHIIPAIIMCSGKVGVGKDNEERIKCVVDGEGGRCEGVFIDSRRYDTVHYDDGLLAFTISPPAPPTFPPLTVGIHFRMQYWWVVIFFRFR